MRRVIRIAFVAAALSLTACRTPHRSVAVDVDLAEWSTEAEIVVENDDTLTLRDIAFFLRYNDHFNDDTLTLRIEVRTPDSLRCEEWLQVSMPRPRKPAALRRQAIADFRRQALLARSGDYRFTVAPVRPVEGVEAVGIYVKSY